MPARTIPAGHPFNGVWTAGECIICRTVFVSPHFSDNTCSPTCRRTHATMPTRIRPPRGPTRVRRLLHLLTDPRAVNQQPRTADHLPADTNITLIPKGIHNHAPPRLTATLLAAPALAAALALTGCTTTANTPVDTASSTSSSTDSGTDVNTDAAIKATQTAADATIGLSEADATKQLTDAGITVRVGQRGNDSYPMTLDYRTDRVTLTVMDGKVTQANAG